MRAIKNVLLLLIVLLFSNISSYSQSRTISLQNASFIANENDGNIVVNIILNQSSTTDITCSLKVVNNYGTAIKSQEYIYTDQIITILANTTLTAVTIPIIDNITFNPSKYFALEITEPNGGTIGSINRTTIYIKENEKGSPIAANNLDVSFLSRYQVPKKVPNKIAPDSETSAEIVVHDPSSQKLFVMNSTESKVEILDFSNPSNITRIKTIDLTSYGPDATSIAVKNGIVAATIDPGTFGVGKVVFFDLDGNNSKVVEVGNLPDMITFTHNGNFAITANEGQPNSTYTTDPEGSVSMIDVSGGLNSIDQAKVTTLTFNSYDSQKASLISQGIRIFGLNNPTVSQDLEPEYITVSNDSKTAWVSLQENNGIAKIDLENKVITNIFPLGYKDHSLPQNSIDISDNFTGARVFMANFPIKGVYMPDALASYSINGIPYIISANEGDAREYGTAYVETMRASSGSYVLDPTKFPFSALLKNNNTLGRLNVTKASGDIDNDGDFDEIHFLGGRSISIWNGNNGEQVYDSGNEFELITSEDVNFGKFFNMSNSNNTFKNRSDDKGPEPEGVTVGKYNGKYYAFIALERTGGIMIYDVTNPNEPFFESYINSRFDGDILTANNDLGGEGIIYVAPENSPNGKGLVLVANEISATISVFQLNEVYLATEPTRQSRSISFNLIGKSKLGLKWTKGNGQNRVLIASENPLSSGEFVLKSEEYSAGDFGVNSSNVNDAYVVYNGSGNSFELTNLKNNTTYYFRLFDYNGTGSRTNYLLNAATNNPNNRSTLRKEAEDIASVGNLLNVYPNPAKDVLNLDLNMNLENANLIIVDETGKVLINTTEVKNFMSLDLSNFSNGSYYLLITNGDEAIYNLFIIKK